MDAATLSRLANMTTAAAQNLEAAVNVYVRENPGGGGTSPPRKPRRWGWRLGEYSMAREKAGALPYRDLARTASHQQGEYQAEHTPIKLDADGNQVGGESTIVVFSHTPEVMATGRYRWHKTGTGESPTVPLNVLYPNNPWYNHPMPFIKDEGIFRDNTGRVYLLPDGEYPPVPSQEVRPTWRNRMRPAGILRLDEWLQTGKQGYQSGKNYVKFDGNGMSVYHKVVSPEGLVGVLDELGSDPDVWLPLHHEMQSHDVVRYCTALANRDCLVYLEATHEPWNILAVKNGWQAWQAQKLAEIEKFARPILGNRLRLVASVPDLGAVPQMVSMMQANGVRPNCVGFAAWLESYKVQLADKGTLRAWGDDYFAAQFADEFAWNFKNRIQQTVTTIKSAGYEPIIYSAGILASTTGYNSADPEVQYNLFSKMNSEPVAKVESQMLQWLETFGCPIVVAKDCEWSIVGHIQQESQAWTPRMTAVAALMQKE